jgi:Cys-tRNA(Pro)/Cys-tRNA(Cys) deacylase
MKKTNAMRILDQSKVEYEVLEYDYSDGVIDGTSVAQKIGKKSEVVFKTLVAKGMTNYYVFVIPVNHELDLKKAATASGEKKIQLIPVKDLTKLTGYIRGGCSPIGMKKQFSTYVDMSAKTLTKIIVSAGLKGLQVELEPNSLVKIIKASFSELI